MVGGTPRPYSRARPTGHQQGSFPRPGGLRAPRWHTDHPTQQHAHPARAPRWCTLLFSIHQRPPHPRPALSSAPTPQPLSALSILPSGLSLSCPRALGLARVHLPPVAPSACPRWHPLLRRIPRGQAVCLLPSESPQAPQLSPGRVVLGGAEQRPGHARGTRQPQVERPQTMMRGGPTGLQAALRNSTSGGEGLGRELTQAQAHWAGQPVRGKLTVQQQGQSHPLKAALQGAPWAATPGPGGAHLGRPR